MSKSKYGVLIIHGFTSSLDCVREIEPPIKALGVPTRMPVLRGHNAASPEALRNVTWPDWVADGESALKDLLTEAEKVILIGHSMGGLVAISLAADHPDQIDSIVVAAAAVQLTSPLAPGRPFHFLAPVVPLFMKKWNMKIVYADPSLVQYDNNYPWAPMAAVMSFSDFTEVGRNRLPEVKMPALIIQSRKDTTVAPESAQIIYDGISTPPGSKKIVWFDKTEHEMFRDCERAAIIAVITDYVRERIGAH